MDDLIRGREGGGDQRQVVPPRISVIGAGRASREERTLARALGGALGTAGAVVITGGLGGVMEAASQGCVEGGGMTIGVLPGSDPSAANGWVVLPLATGLGEARNALVVRAGEVAVAVGGEWGTLSEIALARKMGREVAVLGKSRWDLPSLPRLETGEEAAAWALERIAAERTDG